MKKRSALLLLTLAATLPGAQAQTGKWPDKPVRMVVAFAPGGGTDIIARIIAPRLSQEFGQQFVVDNRGGAGGTIGTEIVVRADPDGYTISLVASSYATAPVLYKLPYDPIKGIAPISLTDTGPFILAVNPTVKAANVKEFIALARAKPGSLNYGSSGTGGTLHLAGELFGQMTGTVSVHVPYKGTGPAITDLIGGQIQFIFANGPSVLPHIKAGRLRAIAVTTQRPSPLMPNLPTVSESVPGYLAITWHGMLAPVGTPKAIVSRLNQALARVLKLPNLQEVLHSQGLEPTHSTPEEFGRMIAEDIARWSKVMKKK
ncbi:MAG: tripartite tricarboxylate transporter substrate binding protein [Pseudomonadota bacterium]